MDTTRRQVLVAGAGLSLGWAAAGKPQLALASLQPATADQMALYVDWLLCERHAAIRELFGTSDQDQFRPDRGYHPTAVRFFDPLYAGDPLAALPSGRAVGILQSAGLGRT